MNVESAIFRRRYSIATVAIVLCLGATSSFAWESPPPPTAQTLNCRTRAVAAPSGSTTARGRFWLDAAMRQRSLTPALAALQAFSIRLVPYGLHGDLDRLPSRERDAAAGIAQLIDGQFVVAAQMLYGISVEEGALPAGDHATEVIGHMVLGATSGSDDDPDLTAIDKTLVAAEPKLLKMPTAAQGYARWVLRGYAFDDAIAVDAAFSGYCSTHPSQTDLAILIALANQVRVHR